MDTTLVAYLLGQLPQNEQARLELSFLADEAVFEQLLVVEDELIDAYVRQELSDEQRGRFESHFLQSPARRKRLEFAHALAEMKPMNTQTNALPTVFPSHETWLTRLVRLFQSPQNRVLVPAGLLLALAFGSTWWLVRDTGKVSVNESGDIGNNLNPPSGPELPGLAAPTESGNQGPRKNDPSQNRPKPADPTQGRRPKPQPAPTLLAYVLTPESVRGVNPANSSKTDGRLVIPKGVQNVQLMLDLDDEEDYKTFNIEIRTAEGTEVFQKAGLRPFTRTKTTKALKLLLPVKTLGGNDYIINVSGVTVRGETEELHSYFLSVAVPEG